MTTSMNASRSLCPAKRAVTKNETTRTPSGGWSTNQDSRADLPAHAFARHQR